MLAFSSEHLLTVTLLCYPNQHYEIGGGEVEGFLSLLFIELGKLIGILEITQKMLVWGLEFSFWTFSPIAITQAHTPNPQTYSFANNFPAEVPLAN